MKNNANTCSGTHDPESKRHFVGLLRAKIRHRNLHETKFKVQGRKVGHHIKALTDTGVSGTSTYCILQLIFLLACRARASVGGGGDFAVLCRCLAATDTTADSVVWMLLAHGFKAPC